MIGNRLKHPTHWLTILVILLLSSILVNVILFTVGRSYYLQLNAVRLDPLGLKFFEKAPSSQAADDQQVLLFFGDSRAESWPFPQNPAYYTINRGIGGQTSGQVLARYDQHARPFNADVIVIQVGINDLKTIPLFPHEKERIIADLQANISQILASAEQQEAHVILTTIFPVGEVPLERRPFWSDDVPPAIIEMNQFIAQQARPTVTIFDTYERLVAADGRMQDQFSPDLLHLNKAGYDLLNQELNVLLDQLAEK